MNSFQKLIHYGKRLWALLGTDQQLEDNDGLVLRLLCEVVNASADLVKPTADPKVYQVLRNLGAVLERKGE